MPPNDFQVPVDVLVQNQVDHLEQELLIKGMLMANQARNVALDVLAGPRSGKRYRIPGTRKAYYIASAPGEPPAARTDVLRLSWRPTLNWSKGHTKLVLAPAIESTVPYARPLDTGYSRPTESLTGKSLVVVAARPYSELIKSRAYPAIVAILNQSFRFGQA